jgi:hypothetical protein
MYLSSWRSGLALPEQTKNISIWCAGVNGEDDDDVMAIMGLGAGFEQVAKQNTEKEITTLSTCQVIPVGYLDT